MNASENKFGSCNAHKVNPAYSCSKGKTLLLKDELVGFEEVLCFAGVFPPSLDLLYVHLGSVCEERLDGVCDLQLASP